MAREVRITTSKLNRFGFRMLSEGGDIEQYNKNNLLLFMHFRPFRGTKDEILAIGNVENLRWEGDDLIGTPVFDQSDPFAKQIEQKWESGVYKMVSIGAEPTEWSDDPKYLVPGQKYATITKWRLDEISIADIGANDDAIRLKNNSGQHITLKDGTPPEFLKLIDKTNQTESMKKIALKFGLPENASEDDICTAIEKERLQSETLKADAEKVRLSAITSAVDAAIKKNPTLAAQRQHFIDQGNQVGLESINVTLSLMEPAVKPMDIITLGKKPDGADKKFSDLTSEEVAQLKTENVEQYKLMYCAEYGCDPKF